ncbi:ligase-associated DNA damage response endonuclease PdeM [Ideonella sp.]|uniref:ligase-associated DNA damage response endonuclease PdeM n=1 Tax=Ideonella sp. TaxID=1929293 RepID=UPI003BB7A0F3
MAEQPTLTEAGACPVHWAGQDLQLLPDRALWWPAQRVLFIADLHIGKAATYRALGQPVPGGTTQQNLARLSRLIDSHRPKQIVFLGDFLHAAQAQTPDVLAALAAWRQHHREHHPDMALTLVRGNHDSRAGDPPATLDITVVDEPHLIGPYAACHHPQAHATHFVLAGHLHPSCSLRGPGRDRLRLPCFVLDTEPSGPTAPIGMAILPAFGEFTGGWPVQGAPGRRLYAVGGGGVWALPG